MATQGLSMKDQENVLHEMIYKSISTLILIYPTSVDFKEKFKPGMFRKNNQPGSQQVVYLLLSIIDPEDINKRITCWPITDIRMESKFRMEVMRFYAHLQEKYDDFGLKTLLSSHLITPGGYKFAKFILKLTDLAWFVHLSKDRNLGDILLRPKPSKHDVDMSSDMMLQFKNATQIVKDDATELLAQHENLNREYDSEIEAMDENLLEIKRKIHDLHNKSSPAENILQEEFKKSGLENYENWLKSEIQIRLTKLSEISKKFKNCSEVTKYLLSKDNVLSYNKSNDLFSNAIDSDDKLNLIKFFENVLKYLQGKLSELDFLPASFIKPQTELLGKIKVEQEQIHYDTQILLSNIAKAQSELFINVTLTDI